MKTFAAECPHCSCTFQAQESYLGRKGCCSKCGESFVVQRPAMPNISNTNIPKPDESDIPNLPDFNPEYATQSEVQEEKKASLFSSNRKFYSLKFLSSIYLFVGAIILFGGIAASIAIFFTGSGQLFFPVFFTSVCTGMTMLLIGEIIDVVLAIEENTRITAEKVNELGK